MKNYVELIGKVKNVYTTKDRVVKESGEVFNRHGVILACQLHPDSDVWNNIVVESKSAELIGKAKQNDWVAVKGSIRVNDFATKNGKSVPTSSLSRDKDNKINDKDVVWVSSTHVEASALSVLTDEVRQDYYAKVSEHRNSVPVPFF